MIDTGLFDRSEYFLNPIRYKSTFAQSILPFTTVLLNGAYWDSRYPRIITNTEMQQFLSTHRIGGKLLCVADISCDVGGSLEFVDRVSTISKPFWYISSGDAASMNNTSHTREEKDGSDETLDNFVRSESDEFPYGVLVSSVDNLPAELPKDASDYFGAMLFPAIKDIIEELQNSAINSKSARIFFENNNTLRAAMITEQGQLVPRFSHLQTLVDNSREDGIEQKVELGLKKAEKLVPEIVPQKIKKILLLGKGLVSGPVIAYFEGKPGYKMTVAAAPTLNTSFISTERDKKDIIFIDFDVEKDTQILNDLVQDHDIVIRYL